MKLDHLAPWLHVLGCFLSLTQASGAFISNQACLARTTRDQIKGHSSTKATSVCEWLGIPYAQAPVGELRFAPPVTALVPRTNTTFLADTYVGHRLYIGGFFLVCSLTYLTLQGYDCPQSPSKYFAYPNATKQYTRVYANFVNQLNNTQSEDCLKLNIWSKPSEGLKVTNTTTALKPVLVWIHGGRFSGGSSNTPYFDGEFLADAQDIVVVTFNFRMNIFGFPGAPELEQKNLAFLDHYMAVSWVRDNIAAFGGDSNLITIAGQSSGSFSVGNWAYVFKDVRFDLQFLLLCMLHVWPSYHTGPLTLILQEPIVSGMISHSGNVFSFPSNSIDVAASSWYNVSGAVGCGTTGSTLE